MSSIDRDLGPAPVETPRSRRELLRTGSAAAAAAALGVLGIASIGTAKNGDAVRAGQKTTASKPTTLESKKGSVFVARNGGKGDTVGVRGVASSPSGVGVLGEATSGKGASAGVQGTSTSADAAAGRFVAEGGGIAIEADATQKDGVALRTKGRLELSERSGIAEVSGGAEFVIPVVGGLSAKSLVLATLQDYRPGVHVEAATVLDEEEGLIIVRLNQALPEPSKVGWLVLD